ncbi:MAG: hypothetical protein RLZZ59_710 [Pseudomonadota bacterium]|jgi:uncharacterized protein YjbI with pentapeptide repeats
MIDVKTLKYLAENAASSILNGVILDQGFEITNLSPQDQFDVLDAATKNKDYSIFKLLKEKGFNLDIYNPTTVISSPEIEFISGKTIVNTIIKNKNERLLDYLLSSKFVDPNSHNSNYLHDAAFVDLLARTNLKDILERNEVADKVDITDFSRLLSKEMAAGKRKINIAQMLKENGYLPKLDHLLIDPDLIKKDKFDEVDFSNLSCRHMQLLSLRDIKSFQAPIYDLAKLKFQNCDLKKANLYSAGVIDHEKCFSGSCLTGTIATTTPRSAEGSLQLDESNIIFVDPERIFKQSKFIDTLNSQGANLDPRGVCNGLVLEYGRYHLKDRTEEQKALHENIFSKFGEKTSQNKAFIERINTYQKELQPNSKDYHIFKKTVLGNVLTKTDKYFSSSHLIGLNFHERYSGHAIAIRITENDGTKEYRLFDPNFGETPQLTRTELELQIKNLVTKYKFEGEIGLYNLEDKVKTLDIINKHDKQAKYLKGFEHLIDSLERNDIAQIKELAATNKGLPAHQYSIKTIKTVLNTAKSQEALVAFLDNCQHIHWRQDGDELFNIIPYKEQSQEMIELFLRKGADLTNTLRNSISGGFVIDSKKAIQLINAGVNFTKEDGEKLLGSFSTYSNPPLTPELIKTFVDHNVDLNKSYINHSGKTFTVLDGILEYAPPVTLEQLPTLKALIENGANVTYMPKTKDLLDQLIELKHLPPLSPIRKTADEVAIQPITSVKEQSDDPKSSYVERLKKERIEFQSKSL